MGEEGGGRGGREGGALTNFFLFLGFPGLFSFCFLGPRFFFFTPRAPSRPRSSSSSASAGTPGDTVTPGDTG